MKTSIEQLAEKLNGKLWIKEDKKRIYLDRGFNTKKMSTKTYIYQVDGEFKVSCYIDCPSQGMQWIKSQQEEVVESVLEEIEDALTDETYVIYNEENNTYFDGSKETTELGMADTFRTEKKALENISDYSLKNVVVKSVLKSEHEQAYNIICDKARIERELKKSNKSIIEKPIINRNTEKVIVEKSEPITMNIGKKYSHKMFGIGELISEDNDKCVIKFECGEKSLLKRFANLTEVE